MTPLKSATAESLEAVMFSDAEPTGPDSPPPPPHREMFCSVASWEPPLHRSERTISARRIRVHCTSPRFHTFLHRNSCCLHSYSLPVSLKLTPGDAGKSKSTAVTIVEVQFRAFILHIFSFKVIFLNHLFRITTKKKYVSSIGPSNIDFYNGYLRGTVNCSLKKPKEKLMLMLIKKSYHGT